MTRLRQFALIALGAALSTAAIAQGWPSRTVKLVVPFTAGSATDIVARTLGQKLTDLWGQPVVVDNRPGAGATIGEALVAHSSPDGYTLLVNSAAQTYNPSIYSNLTFDTHKDFINIAALAGQPNVLVVAPSTGFKTVGDLIAAAKAKPGSINFASAGTGSGTHINAEKFRLAAGIDVVHIPYNGTPEALTDTIAGRVTYYFSPISAALPHIKEGKLVALGVSTAKRSSVLPNVPTIAESGLPGFDYSLWVGLFAPAGTPPDIIDKIARDTARALATPEVAERLSTLGAELMPMTPAEFTKFVNVEIDDSGKVIRAANIKVQ